MNGIEMSGIEKIDSALALIGDISKVETPQYTVSMKKFDQIADVYRRLIFFVSVVSLNTTEKNSEEYNAAYKTITKIAKNPECYNYDQVSHDTKEIINKACEQIRADHNALYKHVPWSEYDERQLKGASLQNKKDLVKRHLKEMLQVLTSCKTYPANFLDKALTDGHFEEQTALLRNSMEKIEAQVYAKPTEETVVVADEVIVETPQTEQVSVESENPKKKTFWQKLFNK